MPANVKSLKVTISAVDVDHQPTRQQWSFSITTGAPFLTAGRIIDAIRTVGDEQGCPIETDRSQQER